MSLTCPRINVTAVAISVIPSDITDETERKYQFCGSAVEEINEKES